MKTVFLTEYCDDGLAHFLVVVFDIIRKQSHVAHDYQPNLMMGVVVDLIVANYKSIIRQEFRIKNGKYLPP